MMTLSVILLLWLPQFIIDLTLGLQPQQQPRRPSASIITNTDAFAISRPAVVSSFQHHQQSTTTCLWSAASSSVHDEVSSVAYPYDWDEQFEELQSFLSTYGHCNFPQKNPPINKQLEKKYPMLKRFCADQREEYQRLRQRKRQIQYRKKMAASNSHQMSLREFDRDICCRRLDELGFEFDSRSARWYDNYHELLQYISDNNNNNDDGDHNNMRRLARSENPSLYNWAYVQRARRSGSNKRHFKKLHDSQIKLLDDIGFTWESDVFDDKWNTKYQELVAFRNQHGHFNTEYGSPLYKWINHQRRRRRFGKSIKLREHTDEQMRLLNEIEFPWKPDRYDAKWYAKYAELQRFQMKHGHCRPNMRDANLYRWCLFQQRKYEDDMLSKEQIKLLDKIDFVWERQRNWEDRYNELYEFLNEHGHLGVSQDSDSELYEWTTTQRERYHGTVKPTLSDIQIDKLEGLHFCWSLDWRDRTWHEKYTETVEFFKGHGHVRVTKKENPSLHNWIKMQEKRYKEVKGQKPLSEEELGMLEQIDFPFLKGQSRMTWNVMYTELTKYLDEHNGRFPTRHKDDPHLNRWMRQQRHRFRCAYGYAPLSDEQKALLESIDFPMYPEGKHRRYWYEKYDDLVQFWNEHGHFEVDRRHNASLYNWVDRQRSRHNWPGMKPQSKLELYLLERIGFAWGANGIEIEWQKNYNEVVKFLEARGHLPSAGSKAAYNNQKLGRWLETQRKKYKGIGTYVELTEHQIQQLEKIGVQLRL